jgi:hypothetical protein
MQTQSLSQRRHRGRKKVRSVNKLAKLPKPRRSYGSDSGRRISSSKPGSSNRQH